MRRCGWTRQQYGDRKSGRTHLKPLERQELLRIIGELHDPDKNEMELAKQEKLFCNESCFLYANNHCIFTLDECPKYQLKTKE